MRVLLDTHALLWWLDGDRRLSRGARKVIADEDHTVLVSAASAWEIATKVRLGKLPGAIEGLRCVRRSTSLVTSEGAGSAGAPGLRRACRRGAGCVDTVGGAV